MLFAHVKAAISALGQLWMTMMRTAVLGLRGLPRCCGGTRLAVRTKHDDWMAAVEREARAHRPGKGGDGLSAVQRHLMDSLDYEIKGEMSECTPFEPLDPTVGPNDRLIPCCTSLCQNQWPRPCVSRSG